MCIDVIQEWSINQAVVKRFMSIDTAVALQVYSFFKEAERPDKPGVVEDVPTSG